MFARRYSPHRERIAAICRLFDAERRALHPTEVGRATGIHFMTAERILRSCDELFMKLPRSADGVTRFHLNPTARALDEAGRAALLQRLVLTETIFLYAGLFASLSVLCLGIIAIVIWVN